MYMNTIIEKQVRQTEKLNQAKQQQLSSKLGKQVQKGMRSQQQVLLSPNRHHSESYVNKPLHTNIILNDKSRSREDITNDTWTCLIPSHLAEPL